MGRRGVLGVLGVALIASLSANVYLARRQAPAPAAPTSPAAARVEVPICQAAPPPRAVAQPDPGAPCEDRLAAATTALAQAEEELDRIRSPHELFEQRSSSDPELEARLAPTFTALFAHAPDGVAYDLECRGDVCRLEVVQPAKLGWGKWQEDLQLGPSRSEFSTMMFGGGGGPRQDPVTGEPLEVAVAHMRVADERHAISRRILYTLVGTYYESAEVQACKRDHPTPGWLSLRIEMAPAARTFQFQAGGDLPSRAAGRCLIAELERRIAEFAPQVTPDLPGGVFHMRIDVP